MTIAYNWVITQTDYETATGFITTAHWTCRAVDGDNMASIYSTCSWASGTPTIPYASVTMAEVLNWVWESVDKQATEDALAANIALQKNPVTESGTPWNQEATT
jgi:hypothetical protein